MSTKYLVSEESLSGIADVIRTKIRSSDAIKFPVDFCSSIESLPIKPIFLPKEHELHVRKEVTRVAKEVQNVLEGDSIVFIALSDTHYNEAVSQIPTQRAAMAINALTHVIPVDFICHLGDFGANEQQIVQVKDYLESVRSNIPIFYAVGNHDAEDTGLSGEWFYNNTTMPTVASYSSPTTLSDFIGGDIDGGGYCYYDIEDNENNRKLRIFLLNTVEKTLKLNGQKYNTVTTGAQRVWLANKLLELNEKDSPADWGFIILSHHPADYGDIAPLSNLLHAYVEPKESQNFIISDTFDNTNSPVNFYGKNFARFIAQFHGHTHNFLNSKLYHELSSEPGTYKTYNADRICVSGVTALRVNHDASHFGRGFSYQDPKGMNGEYDKTSPPSTTETSFTVNVINPKKNIIHSFNYGAGRYRPISLDGIPVYGIFATLPNSTTSNSAVAVAEGDPYSTIISVNDGCELRSFSITMGGEAVSTDYYTIVDGIISIEIPNVTGDIEIIVVAKAPAVNLLPLALAADGSHYVGDNGELGYRVGCRVSSGTGGVFEKTEAEGDYYAGGLCCTGYIPIHPKAVIRIKNITIPSTTTAGIGQENISCQKVLGGSHCIRVEGTSSWPTMDENGVLTIDIAEFAAQNGFSSAGVNYFRLTCGVISDETIITVDEFE